MTNRPMHLVIFKIIFSNRTNASKHELKQPVQSQEVAISLHLPAKNIRHQVLVGGGSYIMAGPTATPPDPPPDDHSLTGLKVPYLPVAFPLHGLVAPLNLGI